MVETDRDARAARALAPRPHAGTALVAELDATLSFPGMPNLWWMPIQTRTEMLATGVRSPLGIKVFGDDLASIEATAVAIEKALEGVPGTRSAVRRAPDRRPTTSTSASTATRRRATACSSRT